ncbi:MAG: flagellar export chaperone FliS [Bryobacterales bacterium]|nr:flagellar export chaperone FliS [Bryobacterales bacterium]
MYQPQHAYFETEVLQAEPLKLVQLLYNGAIEAVQKARIYVRQGQIRPRSEQITKAMDILTELATSVDRERGGELATNLVELYDYMQRQLQAANFQQIEEPLAEVEKLLSTMAEAWNQIAPEPAGAGLNMAAYAGSSDDGGYSPRSFVY